MAQVLITGTKGAVRNNGRLLAIHFGELETRRIAMDRCAGVGGVCRLVLPVGLALMICGSLAFAGERTVHVDRMGGLGPYVEEALQRQELGLEFVDEDEAPSMKAWLKRNQPSAHAEMLYREKLGRTEDRVLELVDAQKGKVLVRYKFRMDTTDRGLKSAAAEFAARVKKLLERM